MFNVNIFNFLKGISCLFVFIFHCYYVTKLLQPEISANLFFFTPAWTAVWIFFILAGYLTGQSFIKKRYSAETFFDVVKFYGQRALRILPLYFFVVFLDISFINTNIYFDLNTEVLKRVLTLSIRSPYGTPMIGNLWFVCTLLQLYLLAPLFYKFVFIKIETSHNNKIFFLMLCILLLAVSFFARFFLLGRINWASYIYENVIFNLDFFFGGFLFCSFTSGNFETELKKKIRPLIFVVFSAFVLINMMLMKKHAMLDVGAEDIKVFYPTLTIVMTFLLIYFFETAPTSESKNVLIFFNPLKWIERMGVISFGFFLCHCQTIYNIAKICKFDQPTTCLSKLPSMFPYSFIVSISSDEKTLYSIVLLSFVLTFLFALIIYHFFEKPINSFRKKISKILST